MVISRLSGGMGNQMFQYAIGRALAIKNNTKLGLDLTYLLDRTPIPGGKFRDYGLGVFNINASIVSKKEIPPLYRKYNIGWAMRYVDFIRRKFIWTPGREKKYTFSASALLLAPNTYLEGWWQSEKYFKDIRSVLLEDFSLNVPLSDRAKDIEKEIQSVEAVSVHIRRDDYLHNKMIGPCSAEYYHHAMETISKKNSNAVFFIFCEFSEDVEWIKSNFDNHYHYTIVQGLKNYEDIILMSTCKHNIIANSSFSWWSAWLNINQDKIVIAPKEWFTDKTDTSDLIPTEWVRL